MLFYQYSQSFSHLLEKQEDRLIVSILQYLRRNKIKKNGAECRFDSSVPECSSSEVKNLVVEISKDELRKQVGATVVNNINMVLNVIRTTSINDQTGSLQCAAELDMIGPRGESSIPITYIIEVTDDGKEFYVNVFGL